MFSHALILTGPTACGKTALALAVAPRLGAEVVITALFDEGTDAARIVRLPLTFTKGASTRKLRVEAGALKETP